MMHKIVQEYTKSYIEMRKIKIPTLLPERGTSLKLKLRYTYHMLTADTPAGLAVFGVVLCMLGAAVNLDLI